MTDQQRQVIYTAIRLLKAGEFKTTVSGAEVLLGVVRELGEMVKLPVQSKEPKDVSRP